MKPLLWAAAGGGVIATLLLVTRRASAQSSTTPAPSPMPAPTMTYGEKTKVSLAVPAGWRRVTSAEVAAVPDLLAQANALRFSTGFASLPYGTLAPFVASDGRAYATWVEQHYHEPGGPVKPWGLHHGVTLLASTASASVSDEWRGARYG